MEILIVCGGGASSSFIAQNVYKAGNGTRNGTECGGN